MSFNIGDTIDSLITKLDTLGRDAAHVGLGFVIGLFVTWVI